MQNAILIARGGYLIDGVSFYGELNFCFSPQYSIPDALMKKVHDSTGNIRKKHDSCGDISSMGDCEYDDAVCYKDEAPKRNGFYE
jgi:hypothetical protein